MGLFGGRKKRITQRVLTASTADLIRIGQVTFGGTSTHPPGLQAASIAELDGYVMAAMQASGGLLPGSPGWFGLEEQFLSELAATAEAGGDWALVGAFCVAANFVVRDAETPNARYLDLMDRALLVMRDDGVAFTVLPEFALRRWERVHGRAEYGFPAHWPSWREDLTLPALGDEPAVTDLLEGEPRRLVQLIAASESNLVFAERRGDTGIAAVMDGAPVDGRRRRWDWFVFAETDYTAFLRELGERYVTATAVHWAHDDLKPYFPCRARSRDELRQLAASA
jgi:hypothetical protein